MNMNKLFLLVFAFAMCCLCGCGHNIMTITEGEYLNLGYDPNNSKVGVQYADGTQINVINKDNTKVSIEHTDSLDLDGRVTAKTTKVTYEIKEQVTDADVELEKVKCSKSAAK